MNGIYLEPKGNSYINPFTRMEACPKCGVIAILAEHRCIPGYTQFSIAAPSTIRQIARCPYCGRKIESNQEICNGCGAPA